MITVESGVPLPAARFRYPYKEMQVGDSFFVAGKKPGQMYVNNARAAKVLGGKYVARAWEDGVRVWKVE